MKSRPTIFLSGVSHEFGTFRDAVEVEIQKKGCFAENQPGFAPDYRTVAEMLRRRLHDADAMIHIVGFRYGAEPHQRPAGVPRRSYTQMELDIARELQKPVYVFLSNDARVRDAPQAEEQPEAEEATTLQLAYRVAVTKTNHLYYVFRDKAELVRLAAEIPPVQAADFRADISRIVKYAPEELVGRDTELAILDEAWAGVRGDAAERFRVLTFVALGGEGKTSLVARWAAGLAHRNWPGCDGAFAWSFYSQGAREQVAASSDIFLKEALVFFGDPEMAGSAQGSFEKGRRLAQLVGERRALLVLDGLEPLQYPPTSPTPGELKDQGLAALLKGLATNSRGLCVVTTRYSMPDLRAYWKTSAPEHELVRLSTPDGVRLLRMIGVKIGSQTDFEQLVEELDGHALSLQIIGQYLVRAHHGDVRRRDRVEFDKANAKVQGGHAFRAMDAYVKWLEDDSEEARRELTVLQLLGLFDRPATMDCVAELRRAPIIAGLTEPLVALAEEDWELTLSSLRDARLLAVARKEGAGESAALDAHPLLREYFAIRLRSQQPEAWKAAHARLFEHLRTTANEGEEPTLEDLQPLYQAVAHGCQAGQPQEALDQVLFARIRRGNEHYSRRMLGAVASDLGAVAWFFEVPWSRPSRAITPRDQQWILSTAAFCLRSLGRLVEALEPSRAALEAAVESERWAQASVGSSNLAELELALGEVAMAMKDAERSIVYADRRRNDVDEDVEVALDRMIRLTVHAAILAQAGRGGEAEARFREAEQTQAKHQPAYPLLYSLRGFQYCQLLLAEAERAAWKRTLDQRHRVGAGEGTATEVVNRQLQSCDDVLARGLRLRAWRTPHDPLLDIAFEHLTIGRAAFYKAILESATDGVAVASETLGAASHGESAADPLATSRREIEAGVAALRRGGAQEFISQGLLTRAWLRSACGRRIGPESARIDLDEAWEIAERGPMPLFLADIHLHRARLFGPPDPHGQPTTYPWTSPQHDLAEARRLVEKHGYVRRMEELEDAEAALAR